jgi:predicted porin
MKKSLLALAVLGAFAGVASAQSSVTLFGIIDVSAQNIKADNKGSTQRLASGSNATSRIGFRGVEDIGGGLKGGFWLETGIGVDTGSAGAGSQNTTSLITTQGKFFDRRATVSLMGGFGEIRLGRDYTPTFWNDTLFDVFGTNGVGSSVNIARNATAAATANPNGATVPVAGNAFTFVRADNSIGYFLPADLGGLYGQVMLAAPEGLERGKYQGLRLGYGAGPINIAVAFAQQDVAAPKYKTTNLGASYDMGMAKILFQYAQEKGFNDVAANKETRMILGAVVPVGAGEFKVSLGSSKGGGPLDGQDASQIAFGYVHNLSKRTAVYTHYSQVKNKGGLLLGVAAGAGTPAADADGKTTAKGFEVGVRHSF